ncbi:hypothetical protein RFI_30052 [Reticulomyxa filosa]|uniref:G-patch domain-containing protein n=1 Tax=Reticulomyxa filosa TaxID=46433 RepID=X6M155_RETFI|nr:hypothetical protein RFI_30052 [Reticulomyxa filosa]|eukprot:ETO07336.1 hypothetical protein RFI_30052 [Reticulomyxa filosa]
MTDDGQKKGFSLSFGGKQSTKVRSSTALRAQTLERATNGQQIVEQSVNSESLFSKKTPIIPLIKKNVYIGAVQPASPLERDVHSRDGASTDKEEAVVASNSNNNTEGSQVGSVTSQDSKASLVASTAELNELKGDHEISSEEGLSSEKKYGLIINTHGRENAQKKKNKNKKEKDGDKEKGIWATIQANRVPGLEHVSNTSKKFQLDVAQRPDMDDMAKVSNELIGIEQFGKAALLGMGWKEGQPIGKDYGTIKVRSIEPIQAKPRKRLLGLGANENLLTLSEDKRKKGNAKTTSKDIVANGNTSHANETHNARDTHDTLDQGFMSKTKKRKINHDDVDSSSLQSVSSTSSLDKIEWIKVGLLVRVVNRTLCGGKVFQKKGRVLDIISPFKFTVEVSLSSSDHQDKHHNTTSIVECCEKDVETVIPRKANHHVLILRGKYKGETGTVMSRNSERLTCTVQLLNNLSPICGFHYNDRNLDMTTLEDISKYILKRF